MASPPEGEHDEQSTPKTVTENIRSVLEMQSTLEHQRSVVDRIADAIGSFSGSMTFVFIHIVWFTAWFLINTRLIPSVKPFDPFPFILLAMMVSVEGVLLSTFVLMKQNRMQYRADIRNQLDLQINLLSEQEATKTLQVLCAICEKLDIPLSRDADFKEMASTTSVDMLAERVKTELEPKD